jgi:CRISPR/Cas system-associated exonuclease Cas4 (RecB family)
MPISNPMKLFKNPKNEEIKYIRVSTLAAYFHCAAKAYLQAIGVESPSNEATSEGTRIHNDITASRPSTALERELELYLKQFMVSHECGGASTGISGTENKVFMREWLENGKVVGYIESHGFDDFRVDPDKKVTIVEYKTTSQKIVDWYKLSTAIFQLKIYCWMLEPILKAGGYSIDKAEIVYLPQPDKRRKGEPLPPHMVEPLGVRTIIDYNAEAVEADIRMVFNQMRDPTHMLAPARYKCYICHPNFKALCPFQTQGNTQ